MEIYNRKAKFNYFIMDEIECGIELIGTEVKSLRAGKADFNDSYARIKDNEVFLTNMFISKYEEGSYLNHEERRERKLLLHKAQISKLSKEITLENKTLIPLKLYFTRGKAKILLGVCKGKKLYDKRQTIKQRDIERRG
ncbi:MAG: SsrA-binding protein SmpB [Bacilli bacterium]